MIGEVTTRQQIGGKYTVKERLPTRGSSKLYVAIDADTGMRVAVRHYGVAEPEMSEEIARLTRISKIASRFLADIVDVSAIAADQICVAQRLYGGEALPSRLARKGRLSTDEAASLAARVLKALDALHSRGFAHGGLRPSRVFHERVKGHGWHIKLLSAGVRSVTRADCLQDAGLTAYSPPEWLDGEPWTERSDLWCFGVMFHELLTGRRPFDGDDPHALRASAASGTHAAVTDFDPNMPSVWSSLIGSAIDPDPARRPENAGAMLDSLFIAYPQLAAERASAVPRRSDWTRGGFVGRPGARSSAVPTTETAVRAARRKRSTNAFVLGSVAGIGIAGVAGALLWMRLRENRTAAAPVVVAARPVVDAGGSAIAIAPPTAVTPVPSNLVAAPQLPVAADAGAAMPGSSNPHSSTHRTATHEPVTPAAPAPSGFGTLRFRAVDSCALMLDGQQRGDVSRMELTLPEGTHVLTCHSRRGVQRLVVHIRSTQLTHVEITSTGEAAVFTDPAP